MWQALRQEADKSGDTLAQFVERTLSEALGLDRHSLFQVSTSNALVQGVFEGAVTVGDLKRHGDFGLGTFEGLDGELVMLDGVCYQASGGGVLRVADDDWAVPFAVVTRFVSDREATARPADSLADVQSEIDGMSPSGNLFAAIRADGNFRRLDLRAACKAKPGENLVEATGHQSEFTVTGAGTLVGFWTPTYARTINVPGYHFHFVSSDRSIGGHVFDLAVDELELMVRVVSDLHVAIPETAEFLAADLRGDRSEALRVAESPRQDPPLSLGR